MVLRRFVPPDSTRFYFIVIAVPTNCEVWLKTCGQGAGRLHGGVAEGDLGCWWLSARGSGLGCAVSVSLGIWYGNWELVVLSHLDEVPGEFA